jgi:hypothetical protein
VNKTSLPIWFSPVPEPVKEVQELFQTIEHPQMSEGGGGYWFTPVDSAYADVPQRWLVIYSEKAYERELKNMFLNKQSREFPGRFETHLFNSRYGILSLIINATQ